MADDRLKTKKLMSVHKLMQCVSVFMWAPIWKGKSSWGSSYVVVP